LVWKYRSLRLVDENELLNVLCKGKFQTNYVGKWSICSESLQPLNVLRVCLVLSVHFNLFQSIEHFVAETHEGGFERRVFDLL